MSSATAASFQVLQMREQVGMFAQFLHYSSFTRFFQMLQKQGLNCVSDCRVFLNQASNKKDKVLANYLGIKCDLILIVKYS